MLFQNLNIKNSCFGIFSKGSFFFDQEKINKKVQECEFSWKYSPEFEKQKHIYLFLLLKTENLKQFCTEPSALLEAEKTLQAQQKAANYAKINLEESCFFDLLPEHQLESWFSLREQVLLKFCDKSLVKDDYDILRKAHILASTINRQKILFNNKSQIINYDIFGSATGRLTTKKGSFPILNLKKEERQFLLPKNDLFLELDFNAAELRTLMALSDMPQPQEDIHNFFNREIFNMSKKRSELKERVFAWLYNPSSKDTVFVDFFDKNIYEKFYDRKKQTLKTPYGREIKVEERKAQNYLLQSTTSDIVIENAFEIMKMLKNKKTNIAFTLHDSVILDMHKEDASMVQNLKDKFETTRWGKFFSTCKIGKNFGSLKELKF